MRLVVHPDLCMSWGPPPHHGKEACGPHGTQNLGGSLIGIDSLQTPPGGPLAAQGFPIRADGVWAGKCVSLGLPVGTCGKRSWDEASVSAREGK